MDDAAARRKVKQYTKDAAGFVLFCFECLSLPAGDTEGSLFFTHFKLWPEQARAAAIIFTNRLIVWLKARQVGATWVILAFILYRSLFNFDQEFMIISLNEKEARKSLDRIKSMISNLPEWCKPELEVCNTSTIKIAETGSIIEAMATSASAGRGRTPTGMLIDEDAYQLLAKQTVAAALPGMEKRKGWIWRVSTGNGTGNDFEKTFHEAEQGRGAFTPIFLDCFADPSRDQKWYDEQLEQHGREYMMEAYPRNSVEAFLGTGRPFFGQEQIALDISKPVVMWEDGFLEGKEFITQARGWLRVFKRPVAGRRYVIGADVSEGLEKGDWSTAIVRDAESLEPVARVRCKVAPVELADYLWMLGEWYAYTAPGEMSDPALLAVESNNHGIAATGELVRRGYRRLYYHRDLVMNTFSERPGWLTTAPSRRLALGKLQDGYRTGRVKVIDREQLEEMSNFAYRGTQGKPQAGAGCFDDLVMADAICVTVAGLESAVEVPEEEYKPNETAMQHAVRKDLERMIENRKEYNNGIAELGG